MPQQTLLSDEKRLAICELADEGLSVRQIAARLGVAPSTVTRTAQRMGLAFDRGATEKATAARVADAKARRSMIALRLLELANAELDRLSRPYRAHAFIGGQVPGYYEHVLPQPDAAARLAIVRTAAVLIDKHTRLTDTDGDIDGHERARSLIGDIARALDVKYAEYQYEAPAV